jgi:hypothetical protein
MEEFLIILLQALAEFLIELMMYGGLDFLSYKMWDSEEQELGCGWSFIFLVIGGLLGMLVNFLHPRAVLPWAWLRILALVAAPLAAGYISEALAKQRQHRGTVFEPRLHFWFAFLFTLGFEIARFAWAAR